MRIVVSGGGTGGHIYPALALINEFKRQEKELEVIYIGSEKGLEQEIIEREGIPFIGIDIKGFKRKLTLENIKTLILFLQSTWQVRKRLKQINPHIVIGTGGYVSGPVLFAASQLKIPTLIHEQNVIAGLANRFLSRFVQHIAISFKGSEKDFPQKKVVYTGNPRASEVVLANRQRGLQSLGLEEKTKIVLIVGGSRGAMPINQAFLASFAYLTRLPQLTFIYVTGQNHFEKIKATCKDNIPANVRIIPYIFNMPEVLAATELIINRAGASFLAEITALGIPSILIPSPYVTNDHQKKNAQWMEQQGAAKMIEEKNLNGETLYQAIKELYQHPLRLKEMSEKAKKLGVPQSATLLYQLAKTMCRNQWGQA